MPDQLVAVVALLLFFFFISGNIIVDPAKASNDDQELRTYIVHVLPEDGVVFSGKPEIEAWHKSFLQETVPDSGYRIKHSYSKVFSGFAARLTESEANALSAKDEFVKVMPDVKVTLSATRTPEFLGLVQKGNDNNGVWSSSGQGKGVIIGVLDSGVDPTHPSFDDTGLPPPLPKWNGVCEFASCNNKIISARSFVRGSPIDNDGHGTHTASTAAGNFVNDANELGQAKGTASGVAPLAHLAIYKVCAGDECAGSDVLAGIDAAVKDGVDVMSMSLGYGQLAFTDDVMAIGAFGAVEAGVFVSVAAGNDGPYIETVENGAPWLLTVAAASVDRKLPAVVTLGDGQEFIGESLFQSSKFSSGKQLPLILPGERRLEANCTDLNSIDIYGKIVLCAGDGYSSIRKGLNVFRAGAAAMILYNDEYDNNTIYTDRRHVLPVSAVTNAAGLSILKYLKSTKTTTAAITFKATIIGTKPAPAIAAFSSRGPNKVSLGILKPDISGPGLNILAAYPSSVKLGLFHMSSGTSMATPHLSGVAALLKNAHPEWSTSAIKSAIMTTSYTNDNTGAPIKDQSLQPASFFSMGAGHVNPAKATDPGLVFETDIEDYVGYLCSLGYDSTDVSIITRRRISCSDVTAVEESQLNYPAIVVTLSSRTLSVNRTVTNVGNAKSSYTVEVERPAAGLSVTVEPEKLEFGQTSEKNSFVVSLSGSGTGEGSLKWVSTDNKYVVRVPIVVL